MPGTLPETTPQEVNPGNSSKSTASPAQRPVARPGMGVADKPFVADKGLRPSDASDAEDNLDIPDLNDQTIAKPKAGELLISDAAIASRMKRMFTPKVSGQFKLADSIVQQWKSGGKPRENLKKLFQSVGFCKELEKLQH